VVALTCNPSYSGGSNQENHGSKAALANSLRDPVLKYPTQKNGWWGDSSCRVLPSKSEALNLNPDTTKKAKTKNRTTIC
jgi:hypothetical protein